MKICVLYSDSMVKGQGLGLGRRSRCVNSEMSTQGFESYSGVGRRGGAMEVVTAER